MSKRLLACICTLGLLLAPLSTIAAAVDPAMVPEAKRTRLALYLSAREAWERMQQAPAKVLFLDVRTRAEAMYVGMPTAVDALVPYMEHQEIMSDWDERRHMYLLLPNSDFVQEAVARLQAKGLTRSDPVILICRSGDRSARAADLLAGAGFTQVYSVVEGFEGDLAKSGPRVGQRVVNGWKNADLPWSYQLDKAKMYFPR